MNQDKYSHGLDPKELAHYDPSLIIAIEAAQYCELYDKKYIRFSRLRKRSDDRLNEITNGARSNFGGNIVKHIDRGCREGLLSIEKVSKKDTRISPNIPAIQKRVNAGNKKFRILGKYAKVDVSLPTIVESVSISDSCVRTVTRAKEVSK